MNNIINSRKEIKSKIEEIHKEIDELYIELNELIKQFQSDMPEIEYSAWKYRNNSVLDSIENRYTLIDIYRADLEKIGGLL